MVMAIFDLLSPLYVLKSSLQGRVSSSAAARLIQDESLQNSDLQPGKYEGGYLLLATDMLRCI